MSRTRWTDSIVSRLVACFFLGGLTLSIAFSILEYDRELSLLRVTESQRLVMASHNLQEVLRELMPSRKPESIRTVLEIFKQDPRIIAVRLNPSDGEPVAIGPWPKTNHHAAIWAFTTGDAQPQGAMDFSRQTLMVRSFFGYGKSHALEVLIDGPFMHEQMKREVVHQLSRVWLLLGVMMLAGLLLLRRWLATALRRLVSLVTDGATAAEFDQAAEGLSGELGLLARRIAGMLRRIEQTAEELLNREQAFEHLYHFAPAAMVGFGPDGLICEANTRAADLLGVPNHRALIGQSILAYITPEDRTAFRHAIRQMSGESHHRCTVRVDCLAGWQRELDTELAAVRDSTGGTHLIRVSFADVTESRQLHRSLTEQHHLLELLIDHMAEAVLVVGEDGRITRASHKLGQLVGRDAPALFGEKYDPVKFWEHLGPVDRNGFEGVMRYMAGSGDRQVHEQFETRRGVFRFHVIPVRDESLRTVARLWVVQEMVGFTSAHRLVLGGADAPHTLSPSAPIRAAG